ncbi:MAG TPA: prolyl oligopeptidase family serine peptidase [Vicinamibacterales bacterium]
MNTRSLFATCRAIALVAVAASVSFAQAVNKPITQDLYDSWRALTGPSLSPDGKWTAYTAGPVVGDGDLFVRATSGSAEFKVARGFTGRPQMLVNATADSSFSAGAAQFTGDSRFVAFTQYAPKAQYDAVPRGGRGRPAPTQPRTNLGLVSLPDGGVTIVPHVRSFRLARDGGKYIAYLLEPDSAPPPARGAVRRDPAFTLVLRELATGTETKIADVSAFTFDDAEKWLAYTTSSADSTKAGAFVRQLSNGVTTALLAGRGNYRALAVDRKGTQVAFVSDHDDAAAAKPRFALYTSMLSGAKGQAAPQSAAQAVAAGQFGPNLHLSDRGGVSFTRDGSAVLFALAKPPIDTIPADSLLDKSNYDLWNWKDPTINPVQKNGITRERNKTYAAIYQISLKRAIRLTDDSLDRAQVSDNGRVALGTSNSPYSIDAGWGEGGTDVYAVDATTGVRTLVMKRMKQQASLSAFAKYIAYFHEGAWQARNIATGKTVNLTGALKDVHFFDDEIADDAEEPRPFGVMGWTKDDARLLVYDKYDIWELDPAGVAAPIDVTSGAGRKANITYRMAVIDRDEPGIDAAQPVILSALQHETKESGYWRVKLGASAAPEKLVMGPRAYTALTKARKADEYLLRQSTYGEYPDIYVGSSIAQTTKVSDVNPQEKTISRGTAELVSWLNGDGVMIQGMVYKPAGFDPNKKYPLMVTFYEKLSDGFNNYTAPTGRNAINPLVYNSLGYVVFMPDIIYTIGEPGPSAAKCVLTGIQSLIGKGYIDPKKVGVEGQSWGGYQIAYLITVTNIFAAAAPNAAVVNMTSAYDGIRWESGIARQGQYEHGQSRIGGSLWEYPERYIENSPLFHLDRVQTPIMWMENDADGAVPWYQGIEFYLAMRRLKKEAYMISYNGEGHNPSKRANQKDIDKKLQAFFANKLLGAPAPDWMTRGIPFIEKGRDQVHPIAVAGGQGNEEKRP